MNFFLGYSIYRSTLAANMNLPLILNFNFIPMNFNYKIPEFLISFWQYAQVIWFLLVLGPAIKADNWSKTSKGPLELKQDPSYFSPNMMNEV